jgi:pyruvate kinase
MLPGHKTKIVCTIGPSSRTLSVLKEMIKEGMAIARLNFSHGSLNEHAEDIENIRKAANALGRPVSILVDLPGPKIRVGTLYKEPITLNKGDAVTLTTKDLPGTETTIPVAYRRLPESVSKGSAIYINDGAISLTVLDVTEEEVQCRVIIGGVLLSHKGINLPGAPIFMEPVSERELSFIEFGMERGVTAFGVSFVEKAADILKIKEFARKKGNDVYTVAKIERAKAIDNIDEILKVTDGVMVARGDLGVEIPIETMAVVQKGLIRKANEHCRPVITATQMLLSMTENKRPTRAEATDVANAILDGTDAVMLSEETAIGRYPVETVRMMARIAASSETHRKGSTWSIASPHSSPRGQDEVTGDIISRNVAEAAQALKVRFILTPTETGATARRISRFKPDPWIISFSSSRKVADFLLFSYNVHPCVIERSDEGFYKAVTTYLKRNKLAKTGDLAIMTQGQFSAGQQTTDSMSVISIP